MNRAEAIDPTINQVTCIIPAYNEGKRIGAVIATAVAHPLISEVIVVDDGSTDETASVAENFPDVLLLRLSGNSGKTRAVGAGLAKATSQFIMLIDADLAGVNGDDLTRLIQPVLKGDAEVSMSLRRNAPWLWRKIGIDYISGERVMPFGLIANRLSELERLPRFGLEVWLNQIFVAENSAIAVIKWDGVESPIKVRKHGFVRGVLADAAMIRDLFKGATPIHLMHQIVSLRRLRVKTG